MTPAFAEKQEISETKAMAAAPVSDDLPTYAKAKETMERDLIRRAMEQGGSTYKAAALLDMSQPTFFRKYKELFPDGIQ